MLLGDRRHDRDVRLDDRAQPRRPRPAGSSPSRRRRRRPSSGIASSVSGTPMRLFRLPRVACTSSTLPSAALISSFVLVFPFVPTTPTTGLFHARRQNVASAPSATSVSRTSKTGTPRSRPAARRARRRRRSRPSRRRPSRSRARRTARRRARRTDRPARSVRVSVHTRPNVDRPRGRFTGASVASASATRSAVQKSVFATRWQRGAHRALRRAASRARSR